jgi:hypothetical protein
LKVGHYYKVFFFDRYGKNADFCGNGSSCQLTTKRRKSMLAVYIAVPILVVLVTGLLAVILLLRKRKKQGETRCQHISRKRLQAATA